MLDPWIIEEILKREKEQREGTRVELPVDGPVRPHRGDVPTPAPTPYGPPSDEGERGVVILDI